MYSTEGEVNLWCSNMKQCVALQIQVSDIHCTLVQSFLDNLRFTQSTCLLETWHPSDVCAHTQAHKHNNMYEGGRGVKASRSSFVEKDNYLPGK